MHRNCPLCDQEATSRHHIISRAKEGSDSSRNIIYLCKKCHDELEVNDLLFTPDLVEKLRKRNLSSKQVSSEEYWYLGCPGGVLFLGIKKPRQSLKDYNVFIPDQAPTPVELDLNMDKFDKPRLQVLYNLR